MTDLEITKLCAEAMGITGWLTGDDPMVTNEAGEFVEPYDPLHDDAQAMALVKKFELCISSEQDRNGKRWEAGDGDGRVVGESKDLNRAICLCVANMQQAKA